MRHDGRRICLHHSAELKISVPHQARIRIIRNGALYHRTTGKECSVMINERGVYRIEAYLKVFGRVHPWIFSNPIYVIRG